MKIEPTFDDGFYHFKLNFVETLDNLIKKHDLKYHKVKDLFERRIFVKLYKCMPKKYRKLYVNDVALLYRYSVYIGKWIIPFDNWNYHTLKEKVIILENFCS